MTENKLHVEAITARAIAAYHLLEKAKELLSVEVPTIILATEFECVVCGQRPQSASKAGVSAMHGPHQVAQKSSRTTLLLNCSSVSGLPSRVVASIAGTTAPASGASFPNDDSASATSSGLGLYAPTRSVPSSIGPGFLGRAIPAMTNRFSRLTAMR